MILMMGVAGVGKSVQGRSMADEKGLPWLSTGEFLRMLVSGKRRIDMLAGKLLQDSEIIELADKIFHMIDVKEESILDGFPRTQAQAEWLYAQHKAGLINITMVIHLEADETVVTERLLERGRVDDTKEAISKRFKEYKAVTLPIIKHLEDHGVAVHHIDGNREPEVIHKEILSLFD